MSDVIIAGTVNAGFRSAASRILPEVNAESVDQRPVDARTLPWGNILHGKGFEWTEWYESGRRLVIAARSGREYAANISQSPASIVEVHITGTLGGTDHQLQTQVKVEMPQAAQRLIFELPHAVNAMAIVLGIVETAEVVVRGQPGGNRVSPSPRAPAKSFRGSASHDRSEWSVGSAGVVT